MLRIILLMPCLYLPAAAAVPMLLPLLFSSTQIQAILLAAMVKALIRIIADALALQPNLCQMFLLSKGLLFVQP